MYYLLKVAITEIIDEEFPFFVKCQFRDALGEVHFINEKLPVVYISKNIISPADLPLEGHVACLLEDVFPDANGNKLAKIDTSIPWAIESQEGATSFVVPFSELLEDEALP